MNKYGKTLIGAALGAQHLFPGADSNWETSWEPSVPEATATLWRYMSFAKFCSLLERKELFISSWQLQVQGCRSDIDLRGEVLIARRSDEPVDNSLKTKEKPLEKEG